MPSLTDYERTLLNPTGSRKLSVVDMAKADATTGGLTPSQKARVSPADLYALATNLMAGGLKISEADMAYSKAPTPAKTSLADRAMADFVAGGVFGVGYDMLAFRNAGATTQTLKPSTATVTHLDPNSVAAGGMVSCIVNGTGFDPAVVIEVVGVGTSTNHTWISSNQVQTNYLFPQNPGVYQVGVRNPGEQISNTIPFTVT